MFVYKIVNLTNNKVYVGQTTMSLQKRWHQHYSKQSNTAISKAIKKYGKNNFTIGVIAKANNIDELNYRETYYIRLFNSLAPNGYNLMSGGNNSIHSNESKQKMSKKLKGFGLGRSLSESTKLKIAKFNLGQKRSTSVKLAMSIAKNGKEIIMLNSSGKTVWQGFLLSDCAKQFNLHVSCMRLCLYGKQKAHKGFTFRYVEDVNAK